MRKTLLTGFLFFTILSFGQIELEHTYNAGLITRIKLEYSGEKYYLFDNATNELKFFNADHSLWKTIVLEAPPSWPPPSTFVLHVSEAEINPDTNLEIIYSYYNSLNNSFESKVVSEDGTVLLLIPDASSVALSKIQGQTTKLISKNTNFDTISKVYAIPGLTLEHIYTNGNIKRIQLETSGEKYYLLNTIANTVEVYNQNHSLWKTIDVPKPIDAFYGFRGINFISENQINSDNLLELSYSYYIDNGNTSNYTSKIINENNIELLTVADANSIEISRVEGLEEKVIAGSYDSTFSKVYGLPTLNLEHTYESPVFRIKLENSGEKYCMIYAQLNNSAQIYNSDHSLWKTISLPVLDESYTVESINHISENKINPDNLLELSYTTRNTFQSGYVYESRLINENGLNLLTLTGSNGLLVSELEGFPNKLFGFMTDGTDSVSSQVSVYGLGILGTDSFLDKDDILIAPNPTNSMINIQSKLSIKNAILYNALGSKVKEFTDVNLTKINIESFPSGIYLLELLDANDQKTAHKVIISH